MNKLKNLTVILLLCVVASCQEESGPKVFDLDYMSHIYPENFVNTVNNPFLPMTVGSTFTYTAETAEGSERAEIEVLQQIKEVMGITCIVVRDKVFLNDEIIEDTYDYYAQDKDGNVWYFGEAVDNYIDGVVDNHYGSWEAGVDGAEPGVIMLGNPVLGMKYRQEHYIGEAEDQGEIAGNNESVSVAAGSFTGCLKIHETNPLDPNFLEYKYYAQGIGLVKVEIIDTPVEVEELSVYDIK